MPAGELRNFRYTGSEPLFFDTLCSSPEHAAGAALGTKADAAEADGGTSHPHSEGQRPVDVASPHRDQTKESTLMPRQYVFTDYGDPEVEDLVERPIPEPGSGQVLVGVRADGQGGGVVTSNSSRSGWTSSSVSSAARRCGTWQLLGSHPLTSAREALATAVTITSGP